MGRYRGMIRATVTAAALIALAACATTDSGVGATSTLKVYDPGKWSYWGGDAGQTRYAPLDQINLSNVSRLKVAWRWQADATGGACCADFKGTPLLEDGVLYMPWLNQGMAAIDAGTGKTIWTYEPQPANTGTLAPRSLAYWTDGKIKRLFHNSFDGRLIAVDAKTGLPAREFGDNGQVDLKGTLAMDRVGTPRGDSRSVSPALVVGDIIVVQSIPSPGRNKEVLPGDIRGYDVRTGQLAWTFHVVPRKGEYGYDTWGNNSADFAGQGGVWSMMSADPELGYVYLPTEDPSNDFSGAERPGDNLFSNSIVCLDAKTGKRVWHFQIIHHGTWDLDNPAAPILHDVVQNGKRIHAVSLLTKQSMVFTFDRKTGKPVWPINERPVPQDGVPGEKSSLTQPFPSKPAPLSHMGFDESWVMNFTPELHKQAMDVIKSFKTGPYYTQETLVSATNKGTWIYPGYGGGANWNGAAVDPETGVMYVPIRHKPNLGALAKGDPARTNMAYVQTGGGVNTPMGPGGLPLLKPPYSELVAVDMNKGDQLWRVPTGGAPAFVRNNPLLKGLNLDFDHMGQWDIKPSPVLTKELLYLGEAGNLGGGSGGPMFRAYDKKTGKVVKELELPGLVTAAPMTYVQNGRQYVVVAVSQRGRPAELVAMTLDGASDNGPAPAAGVKAWPAPVPHAVAVAQISATPAELAQGQAAFAKSCIGCHGEGGKGGVGPNITGRNDYDNIRNAIIGGRGEMPALGSSLSPADIDAIAKYVVKTLAPPPPVAAGRGGPPPPRDAP
jgi:glucose dehydrogenase/cytochrome c553